MENAVTTLHTTVTSVAVPGSAGPLTLYRDAVFAVYVSVGSARPRSASSGTRVVYSLLPPSGRATCLGRMKPYGHPL